MAKFTVEEILREYSSDGKRSGIRREENKPSAQGTLETEKLLTMTMREKPLSQEKVGYHTVIEQPAIPQPSEEDLVDIKSTIYHIKAQKQKKAARDAGVSPLLRERFPTQHLNRERVSYLKANGQGGVTAVVPGIADEPYDGAVKLTRSDAAQMPVGEDVHRPSIRAMQDSTRARDKRKKRRGSAAETSYAKDSITGVIRRPQLSAAQISYAQQNTEDQAVYAAGMDGQESVPLRSVRQRTHRQTGETSAAAPDNMEQVRKNLCSLRNVIFFRCMALLLLTLAGVMLSVGEITWITRLTPRIFAAVQLGLAAIGLAVSFPTIKNGLWHFLKFHADSDSMAALPVTIGFVGTLFAVIRPDVLSHEMVHLYIPCALLALFCNAVGRLLVVRRALRNCSVLSKETKKRVLSYISQEEVAEILTRGMIHDVPIVAAVRRADSLCDFLRYTYSCDMADNLCRRAAPVSVGVSLLISVFLTFVRIGTSFDLLWFSVLFSLWTLLITASCCLASAFVSNLPLEWESKKAAASGGTILGYQSADDFFDINAILVEAGDLFPAGSVQIVGMKVFSNAKVDDVLLDAASLIHQSGSILENAFADMISDHESLRKVDDFSCEDSAGLCGWIFNRRVLFGGREMMRNHHIEGLPTKTRESEMTDGDGGVLYLSISGILSAMFSVRITADPSVQRRMRALGQEHISLVIRSVDPSVTLRRLSNLFSYPENLMKILPSSMHHLFQRETADLRCCSASMTASSEGFGAAQLLLGARRIRHASVLGVILQIVSALLGVSLALIHVCTGAYETMTSQFFLLYHLILTALTVLAVRVR